MGKIFICAICGYVGESSPEEEAEADAELKAEFGGIKEEDCAVVCDVCWEKVRPKNK